MLLGKITKYQYFNSFISVVLNFLYDASHIIIRNQTVNFLNTIYQLFSVLSHKPLTCISLRSSQEKHWTVCRNMRLYVFRKFWKVLKLSDIFKTLLGF